MTALQQIGIVILALIALVIVFMLLVKMRLLPLGLWLFLGKVPFAQWSGRHPLIFYGVLVLLAGLTLASWLVPKLRQWREGRWIERKIRADIAAAHAEGRVIESIELDHGIPVIKYRT